LEWLNRQEPEILWDDGLHRPPLQIESDWRKAGELVFDSPLFYDQIVSFDEAQDPEWYKRVNPPLSRESSERQSNRSFSVLLLGINGHLNITSVTREHQGLPTSNRQPCGPRSTQPHRRCNREFQK
jgi:hypothetical protein